MRVVHVVRRFPVRSETFLVAKLVGLSERGVDVHVVCDELDREAWAEFPELDRLAGRVHPRPLRSAAARPLAAAAAGALRRPRAGLAYLAAGRHGSPAAFPRRLVRDWWLFGLAPDLVHVEFGEHAPEWLSLRQALGRPMTVSFRGWDLSFAGLDDPGYYDVVWRRADAVHVLGEDLWRRALARGCPPGLPHVLIPPAVDAAFFAPPRGPRRDGPLRLLSVGRLHWKKGHEYSLQAVRLLLDAGTAVELRVAGTGPDEEAVRAAVADLRLGGRVTLLGGLDREGVRDELARADVLLHAAVSEGFCNAVLEAQAMALPVVCSDADGLGENVVDGETGHVVPRRDPQALATAIGALAGDPERRARLGRAGRERAVRSFRPEQQLEAWVAFYEEVVSRPSLPAR